MQPVLKIVILVAVTWMLCEALKFVTDLVKNRKVSMRILLSYGGMPSAHTAFVTSMASSIYLVDGLTTAFVLSVCLAILVVRDLISLRRSIDDNTIFLYRLAKKSNPATISHTSLEIFVGFCLGIIVPMILGRIIF